jgi:ribonuclease R
LAALSRPLTAKALAKALRLPRADVRRLRRVLQDLVREGRVMRVVGSRFVAARARPADEGRDEPRRRARREHSRVRRGSDELRVGVVRQSRRGPVLAPYRERGRWRLALDGAGARELPDGSVVLARPSAERGSARLVELLGPEGSADADVRAVAAALEIPVDFPPDVEAEAERIARAGVETERGDRREDLRAEHTVTIDGPDARDFDDAVAVQRLGPDRFRLRVSIADVSHYVRPGSALDREARRRGNSVYFPDRAVPMLPHALSSGLCSLVPREDRLTLTAELEFDGDGQPLRARFFPSRIHSSARLTYDEVARWIERDAGPGWFAPMLELARRLHARRLREGSLDFELPEAEVVLDPGGEVSAVRRRSRSFAHRLIEEFMLAANRAVAEHLERAEVPCVYRVHEPPRRTDLRELATSFAAAGIDLDGADAPALAAALGALRGRPEQTALHVQTLRTMRQARYAPRNLGHFALHFPHYLHFTSPIRRYADLVVHRALKANLGVSAGPAPRGLDDVAEDVSARERVAIDAERRILELYRARLMRRHVGAEDTGVISGVARFGVFVTLDTHFVDGLIAGRSLGEGLELEPSKLAAVGRRSGRRYAIGQRVRVRVGGVDADRARVWLEWADAERVAPRRPERSYKRASGGTQRRARSPR